MALSIELARRDISSIVVERQPKLHTVPKGQNLTQRTGEHFKAWKVSEEIRKACVIPHEYGSAGATAYRSLLSGYHFDWFRRASAQEFYAAENERLPQYATERVLRQRAAEFPNTDMLLNWTAGSVSQDRDSVLLELEGVGKRRKQLTARFLVGCDGSNSAMRQSAGIEQDVDDHHRQMVLIVFRSGKLNQLLESFPGKSFFHIIRPELEGYWQFLGRVDLDGTWFYHSPVPADKTVQSFDCRKHLKDMIGTEFDLALQHVGFWDLRFSVAKEYRCGNVFLAGDSAHSHPPYGGYGINLGFEDARNLGWKLAAVIAGWGGEGLLESYTEERRTIFISTAEAFIKRHITDDAEFVGRYSLDRDKEEFERAWNRLAKAGNDDIFAYFPQYSGSSIVTRSKDARTGAKGHHTHQASHGTHLSPQRLSNGKISHDEFGDDFTLIGIDVAQEELDSYEQVAVRERIPLRAIKTAKTCGVLKWNSRLILIRPDHFVAHAENGPIEDFRSVLLRATGQTC